MYKRGARGGARAARTGEQPMNEENIHRLDKGDRSKKSPFERNQF